MLALAIQLCWLLIYAIAFCGVVWLIIYGINEFIYTLPGQVVKAVWFIVLLLVVIAVLSLLAGGGGVPHPTFPR